LPPSSDPKKRKRSCRNLSPAAAVTHGATSEKKLGPLRDEHRTELLERFPALDEHRLSLLSERTARLEARRPRLCRQSKSLVFGRPTSPDAGGAGRPPG
jgi:hypothetical protein